MASAAFAVISRVVPQACHPGAPGKPALPPPAGAITWGKLAASSGGLLAAAALVARRRPACRQRVQRHAWGDDVTFHDASVVANVEAAEGLRLISIEAPSVVSEPFQRAGQFVQAKPSAEAKASFYAISSPPAAGEGPGKLEFLIKNADSNTWITDASAGDLVQLSPAMGRGFDLKCEAWEKADVNQVNIFATGSGVAPMRALIESEALAGKVCRFYYGARSESGMAYADRFESWRNKGIEVVPLLSQGDNNWGGRRGYVQDVMKEDEERGEGFVLAARHGALICGQKEMVAAVRQVYDGLGVPEDRTLLNF